jgi:hypothetical protein
MSTTIAMYFLIIIAGNDRFELVSKPPLTLEQCYTAGEDWVKRGRNHKYECRKLKQFVQSNKGK